MDGIIEGNNDIGSKLDSATCKDVGLSFKQNAPQNATRIQLEHVEDDEYFTLKQMNAFTGLNGYFTADTPIGSSRSDQEKVSSNTFRKTEWDVKKLENHVKVAFNVDTSAENMNPSQLNIYLKSFFEHSKKSDGMEYEPESLIGFLNSFERYLKTKNYPESLLKSEAFREARILLRKKREAVRSIGSIIRAKTNESVFILMFYRNFLYEKAFLIRDNPDCLLAEIYLNNTIYFGEFLKEDRAWRGNLNLVWGDILLERDSENGLEYLTLSVKLKENRIIKKPKPVTVVARSFVRFKTGTQTGKLREAACRSNSSTSDQPILPRVYARHPSTTCPVEAYKIYKTHRPSGCMNRESPFYLAPNFKSKSTNKVWYKILPMSCQRLDALFFCLFKQAGIDVSRMGNLSREEQNFMISSAMQSVKERDDSVVWKANKPSASLTFNQIHSDSKVKIKRERTFVKPKFHRISNISNLVEKNKPTLIHGETTAEPFSFLNMSFAVPVLVQVQVQVQVQAPKYQKIENKEVI